MAKRILCLVFVLLVGCGYEPNAEQNATARNVVAAKVDSPVLERSRVNELLKAAQDGTITNVDQNQVYRIDVEVVSTEISKDARDPAGHGRVHLTGRLTEDVAVNLDFDFADQDEANIQGLKPGQRVWIRGELANVYIHGLAFEGCVLETF